jgi:membrane protease YdiL (CAAX protease family)
MREPTEMTETGEDQPLKQDPEQGPHRRNGKLHSIFVGNGGLRPGWGCLAFLLALFLLGFSTNFLAKLLLHSQGRPQGSTISPALMVPVELISVTLVLLVTFLMARLERRPLARFGLSDRALPSRLIGGLVAGFAAISALVGVLWAMHLLVLHGPVLHGQQIAGYGLVWALGFLLTGIFEEMLLRGYLLFTLARGLGFVPSALLLSAGFGLIHGNNAGETLVGLFSAGAVGLLFCLSIWYTGSLWWAIGFHAAWDWGESFFWSTSDSGTMVKGHLFYEHPAGAILLSGGATGPEGSLFVFPVLLVCALFVFLWWRGKQAPGYRLVSAQGRLPDPGFVENR